MTTQMVLFAIGPDKPGLVSNISEVIHDAGGNFEDSRMTSLAGDFELIVLFSATEEAIEKIKAKCKRLEEALHITTQFKKPSKKQVSETSQEYKFEATGHDRPGIVSRLTSVLANKGVNVISLDTSIVNMAFIGTPMFKVKGVVHIPSSMNLTTFREELEDVCEDMELVLEFTL